MRVRGLDHDCLAAYEDYVQKSPNTTFFHDYRWHQLLENVAGFESKSLLLEDDARVRGVLPLFATKSPFSGTGLVSTPFAVYGGIVADNPECERTLVGSVQSLMKEGHYEFAELRQSQSPVEGLPTKELYVSFIGELPEDPDECLTRIPRKSRATARQARDKHHLEFVTGWHLLDRFYELFVLNKRALGSPVFAVDFFSAFFDYFPDDVVLHGVKCQGEIVACVMSFSWRDTIMAYYSGSLQAAEKLGTMNFMYWKLMEWATERGFKKFDFGRSRAETGAYAFKQNMGFKPEALPYQFVLGEGTPMPNVNPGNPRFEFVQNLWRRLPVPVVKAVGPRLMRYFP